MILDPPAHFATLHHDIRSDYHRFAILPLSISLSPTTEPRQSEKDDVLMLRQVRAFSRPLSAVLWIQAMVRSAVVLECRG